MERYTVKSGDSLWKISRYFNIDINELTRINGLNTKSEQYIIQPGQILTMPSKNKTYDTQLNLKIYDLTWHSIRGAKLKITFDGKTDDYITDESGAIRGLLITNSSKGIKVELLHLNQKEYIVIAHHKKLPLGEKTLRISSREMVIKSSTRAEKGTQQSSKQQEKDKAKKINKISQKKMKKVRKKA